MKMDDRTRDLILELASGSLPEEEARQLEASLTPEAVAELAAHRAVIAMIADAPVPELTAAEGRRLMGGVAAAAADTTRELNAVEIVQPTRRRRINWMPAAAAASALAVFGAVAIGATLLTGGGDDGSATDLMAATSAPATTMAASSLGAEAESATGTVFALSQAEVTEAGDLEFVAEQGATVVDLRTVLSTMTSRQVVLDPTAQPCAAEAIAESDAMLDSAHFGLYDQVKVIAFAYEARADDDSPGVLVYDASTCEPLPQSPDGRLGDPPSR
jgi:hypothetical protein